MKKVVWDKTALEIIRSFSASIRQEIGALLMILQFGEKLSMPQSRPLKQLSHPAFELRLKDSAGIYRVIYVLFDKDKIYVPHAFVKKTQKTPKREIEIAEQRLRRMINENK